MEQYAGIDVSLEFASVCVVDAGGKVIREATRIKDVQIGQTMNRTDNRFDALLGAARKE